MQSLCEKRERESVCVRVCGRFSFDNRASERSKQRGGATSASSNGRRVVRRRKLIHGNALAFGVNAASVDQFRQDISRSI